MKTLLAVLALSLTACGHLDGKSAEYRAVHDKAFWANYNGGGTDAAAWANLKAHEAAEKQVGK